MRFILSTKPASLVCTLGVLSSVFASSAHGADVFVLDFESATGFTTSASQFTDGGSDYFIRTDGSNISSSVNYSNVTGSYFAAQDLDGDGGNREESLTTSSFSITNYTNLMFAVDLAEDQSSDGDEDWDNPDFVSFQYSLDGADFVEFMNVNNGTMGTNFAPMLGSTEITDSFVTFIADFSSLIGDTLAIRTVINLNAGDEDIAFDNLTVTGDLIVVPLPSAVFAGFGLMGVLATRRVLSQNSRA
jgi:hypothetical protein